MTSRLVGDYVEVTAASDLASPTYYWYNHGAYVGRSIQAVRMFRRPLGYALRVGVLDSDDPAFDPIANAPDGWPPIRTLEWVRSLDVDCASYLVEQQANGGDWQTLARVRADATRWLYRLETGPLIDGASYAWRVTPYDRIGNPGTAVTIAAELIVRRPDPPIVSIGVLSGPRVRFAEVV